MFKKPRFPKQSVCSVSQALYRCVTDALKNYMVDDTVDRIMQMRLTVIVK